MDFRMIISIYYIIGLFLFAFVAYIAYKLIKKVYYFIKEFITYYKINKREKL